MNKTSQRAMFAKKWNGLKVNERYKELKDATAWGFQYHNSRQTFNGLTPEVQKLLMKKAGLTYTPQPMRFKDS